jgi:pimeloyl-ACP methyl ester carboxylesterase
MVDQLQATDPTRYGTPGDFPVIYYDYRVGDIPFPASSHQVFGLALSNSHCTTNDCQNPLDPLSVANTSITEKAFQLKKALEFVTKATGASRINVVGHSQGGLVARAYVEGLAARDELLEAPPEPYNGEVDRIVTVDTPHAGAFVAYFSLRGFPKCFAQDTRSKMQMQFPPSDCEPASKRPECFLSQLDSRSLPANVTLTSIASRGVSGLSYWLASDDIVPYLSQDLLTPILRYRNSGVVSMDNLVGAAQLRHPLHSNVTSLDTTIALVNRAIRSDDARLSVDDVAVLAAGVPFGTAWANFHVTLPRPATEDVQFSFATCTDETRCPRFGEDTQTPYARPLLDYIPRGGTAVIRRDSTGTVVGVRVFTQAAALDRLLYLHVFFPQNASVGRGLGRARLLRKAR